MMASAADFLSLSVPRDYGYVILVAAGTLINGVWHAGRIGGFRKAAELPYPIHYADSAHVASASTPEKKAAYHAFNCAQRSHGNFLEHQGAFLAALLVAGVRYPLFAAGAGLLWNVSRVLYAVGYTDASKPNGKGRLVGVGYVPAELLLFGAVGLTGAGLLGWY